MEEDLDHILKLENKQEIEAAASTLTLRQAHALLKHLFKKDKHSEEKLMPLLVGMDQKLFYQLLQDIDDTECALLKEIGPTEALLHKLTLLAHDWKEDLASVGNIFEEIQSTIAAFQPNSVTSQEILRAKENIDGLDQIVERRLNILNAALMIAWNTTRVDLIDHLSSLKEIYRRTTALLLGHGKSDTQPATGLYKSLEDRLNQVFSLAQNAPIPDAEPAIEALTSFGIFYLEDYWELGLLPEFKSFKELKHLLGQKTHQEKALILEKIVAQAEDTLKAKGLIDVKSLKEANIYTKEMLREYLHKGLA